MKKSKFGCGVIATIVIEAVLICSVIYSAWKYDSKGVKV